MMVNPQKTIVKSSARALLGAVCVSAIVFAAGPGFAQQAPGGYGANAITPSAPPAATSAPDAPAATAAAAPALGNPITDTVTPPVQAPGAPGTPNSASTIAATSAAATAPDAAGVPAPPGTPVPSNSVANAPHGPAAPVDDTAILTIANAKGHIRDASVTPEMLQTLFFTAWQHALLDEAKKGFETALPTGGAASADTTKSPGIRELSVGGIAYYNPSKWTVWMNGVRITPEAIPQQVLDIKVTEKYIDVKWFDAYTNKIFPVRLRPQERFNLDSRIFLPGTGAM